MVWFALIGIGVLATLLMWFYNIYVGRQEALKTT